MPPACSRQHGEARKTRKTRCFWALRGRPIYQKNTVTRKFTVKKALSKAQTAFSLVIYGQNEHPVNRKSSGYTRCQNLREKTSKTAAGASKRPFQSFFGGVKKLRSTRGWSPKVAKNNTLKGLNWASKDVFFGLILA